MNSFDDPLIFGKNQTKFITSLEVTNNTAELFIQDQNGNITSETVPNKFWIIAHEQFKGSKLLKGSNHFKWGKQYDNQKEFQAARQYLKHYDIFSIYDPKEALMVLKGYSYYKGLKPQDISILSFDIETTTLEHNKDAKLLLISNTYRKNGILTKKLFAYDDYNDEGEMIQEWCLWVRKMNPSILTGHNINGFDLHYLKYIGDKYNVTLKLGRNGSNLRTNTYESKFRKDGSQDLHYHKSYIYGREIVDTMFLAIKHDIGRKYISYGLKQIIKQEGLERVNRTFYDASQIRHNYKNPEEWTKIKEYCKDDSDDALALFDLFAPAQFYWTQMVPKSFQSVTESATGSQINSIMLRSYIQNAHSIPKADQIEERFEGAISYGNPGVFSNCIKWDVASLYPSIIIQNEIYNKEKDPNAHFLQIIKILTSERLKNKKLAKEIKDQYYKDLEQAQKVGINSFYGFMGAPGLQFNYLEGAAKTTEMGREILKKAIKWSTGKEYGTF